MSLIFTLPRRRLGGTTPVTPPLPPTSHYHEILDASTTRKHLPLNDLAGATIAANRGGAGGADGTYQNTGGIKYRLGALISGNPMLMRSVALSGSLVSIPHITIADLVTAQSCTIDIAAQLDALPPTGSKFVLVTQGLSAGTAGALSPLEITSDGRVRSWVSSGGSARVFTTDAGVIAPAVGLKITYRQAQGVGRFIYVNGVLATSGFNDQVTDFPAPPAGTWYIGAWPGADPFRGMISELASWNLALAPTTIATIGARAQSRLELSLIPDQTFNVSSSGTLNILAMGVANPDSNWVVEVVTAGTNASLTGFTASGQNVNWTTGATAGSATPSIRLTRDGGAVVSITRSISITVTGSTPPPPPATARCYEGSGGTVVNLGNATNKETETSLGTGGSARYNAHGIIARTRWLGAQGCTEPARRHNTTKNLGLFRITAAHNGGCISGMSGYSNLIKDDDYDQQQSGGFSLYPCSDGGEFFDSNNLDVANFTIENMRWHGGWDPVRIGGRTNSTRNQNWIIQDSWFTCTRDDLLQDDGNQSPGIMRRILAGDTIGTGPTNSGCFRFLSMTGSRDFSSEEILIEDCLWWSSRFRATHSSRAPHVTIGGVSGYSVGHPFKLQNMASKPRIRIRRCVYMCDGVTFSGGNGSPFHQLYNPNTGGPNAPYIQFANNVFIWTEHAEAMHGTWASQNFPVPSGWTVMTGVAGRNEWNGRVAEWKQDHPNVRRFNITGIQRPFGGTFNLVDQG